MSFNILCYVTHLTALQKLNGWIIATYQNKQHNWFNEPFDVSVHCLHSLIFETSKWSCYDKPGSPIGSWLARKYPGRMRALWATNPVSLQ